MDPGNAPIRYELARALEQQGRTEEAITQYQAVLRMDPSQVEARDDLAWILATSEDPKLRSVEEADQAGAGGRRCGG